MNAIEIKRITPALLLAASAVLSWLPLGGAVAAQTKPIQIGIAKTFLSEQPKGVVEIATDDFKSVLKQATGLDATTTSKFNAFEIADKLDAKQLDFGIFHAHEFAWVQKKHPELKPLLIAVDKYHIERAYFIVHKNSPAKTLADLRGKKIDLPIGTKEHCRVFLNHEIAALEKKGPAAFFAAIEKSSSKKAAMDSVAAMTVDATVIDLNGLEFYKEVRGPVYEKNLRILQQSQEFPPAVVVYKPGVLDPKIVDQFKNGIIKAHTIPEGRDMMKSWQIESFTAIPKDYDKSLADVLKAYPPPAEPK